MRRKIYDRLLEWKQQRKGETALLIEGARRVGKSYIVEEFARREYRSHILIDFNVAGDDIKGLFNHYLADLDMLFMYLSNYTNTKLYERESLIIFDEVQFCPRARAAIKYLVKDLSRTSWRRCSVPTGISCSSIPMPTATTRTPAWR